MKIDLPQILQDENDKRAAQTSPQGRRRQWIIGGAIGVLALVGLGFPMETVVVAPTPAATALMVGSVIVTVGMARS